MKTITYTMRLGRDQKKEWDKFAKDKGFHSLTNMVQKAVDRYIEATDMTGPKMTADLMIYYANKLKDENDE